VKKQSLLQEFRVFFAKQMAAASGSDDPRFEQIFEAVPREIFLGDGPWKVMVPPGRRRDQPRLSYIETPGTNPVYLYQDLLIALDVDKGINNGVPSLHARWLGFAAPKAGDEIIHIGAGTGYYTAILSKFTLPGGHVNAYEIDERLAALSDKNLKSYENVSVIPGNAVEAVLPRCDLMYVNAGVVELPISWLEALKPKGRVIFPWRPSPDVGLALMITKREDNFDVMPLMPAWFIPCVGASNVPEGSFLADQRSIWKVKSVHKMRNRTPDDTAVAIYEHIWFSSTRVPEKEP